MKGSSQGRLLGPYGLRNEHLKPRAKCAVLEYREGNLGLHSLNWSALSLAQSLRTKRFDRSLDGGAKWFLANISIQQLSIRRDLDTGVLPIV